MDAKSDTLQNVIVYCQPTIFDVPAIASMWDALVQEELCDFVSTDQVERERYALAMTMFLQNPLHIVIVAKDEQKVIGYTHGYVYERPYGKPRRMVFSESSYVLPDYRANGIGWRLVEEFRSTIKERGFQVDCEEFTIPYDQEHVDSWAKRGWHPAKIMMRMGGK